MLSMFLRCFLFRFDAFLASIFYTVFLWFRSKKHRKHIEVFGVSLMFLRVDSNCFDVFRCVSLFFDVFQCVSMVIFQCGSMVFRRCFDVFRCFSMFFDVFRLCFDVSQWFVRCFSMFCRCVPVVFRCFSMVCSMFSMFPVFA
jgi:hypothetical protein